MTVPTWSVVVPVKEATGAKTRLAPAYGQWRPYLARAFATDTIRAAADCARTRTVIVVTDDVRLRDALAGLRTVSVVADPGHGDLNAAILAGAETIAPDERVAAITADLPALTGADLATVLDLATEVDLGVVADLEGVGTTMLTARRAAALRPQFGRDSLRRHRAGGASELDAEQVPAARRDVDLPSQLRDAARLGVGAETAGVLARIHNGTGPVSDPVPQK